MEKEDPFRILVISRGVKSGHSCNSSYRAGAPSRGTPTVPSFLWWPARQLLGKSVKALQPSLWPFLLEKMGVYSLPFYPTCRPLPSICKAISWPSPDRKNNASWRLILKTQTLTGICRRNTLFCQNVLLRVKCRNQRYISKAVKPAILCEGSYPHSMGSQNPKTTRNSPGVHSEKHGPYL